MPKNPLKDYLWVIEKLMRSPMTLAELQDRYVRECVNDDHKELQAKTFFNWRNKIWDIFNIKIEYRDNAYQIVDSEEPARKEALEWLVQSLSINTVLSHSRDLSKRILLEQIPSGEIWLQPIIKAMKESRRVRFVYTRFCDGIGKEVVAEPYCVKVNNRRWYMVCRVPGGHAHHDDYPEFDRFGCIRVYALDRMQVLEVLDETFVYPEDFEANELFRDYYGVSIAYGVPLQRVVVRYSAEQRDYVDTLPLHHSQTLVEDLEDGDAIYEYSIHPTIDFYRALLAFGRDAEVLEPMGFRECFAEESEDLFDIYHPDTAD